MILWRAERTEDEHNADDGGRSVWVKFGLDKIMFSPEKNLQIETYLFINSQLVNFYKQWVTSDEMNRGSDWNIKLTRSRIFWNWKQITSSMCRGLKFWSALHNHPSQFKCKQQSGWTQNGASNRRFHSNSELCVKFEMQWKGMIQSQASRVAKRQISHELLKKIKNTRRYKKNDFKRIKNKCEESLLIQSCRVLMIFFPQNLMLVFHDVQMKRNFIAKFLSDTVINTQTHTLTHTHSHTGMIQPNTPFQFWSSYWD